MAGEPNKLLDILTSLFFLLFLLRFLKVANISNLDFISKFTFLVAPEKTNKKWNLWNLAGAKFLYDNHLLPPLTLTLTLLRGWILNDYGLLWWLSE